MSMSALTLVTLAEIHAFIKQANDEDDDLLEMLADGVAEKFNQRTKRTLMSLTVSALYLDGNGLSVIYLPNWPVTTLGTVSLDDVELTLDTDYEVDLDIGRLIRIGDNDPVWPDGKRNILISGHTAGYVLTPTRTLPHDLRFAALTQIAAEYQRTIDKTFLDTSRSVSGESVSIKDSEFAVGVEEVLKRYERGA